VVARVVGGERGGVSKRGGQGFMASRCPRVLGGVCCLVVLKSSAGLPVRVVSATCRRGRIGGISGSPGGGVD